MPAKFPHALAVLLVIGLTQPAFGQKHRTPVPKNKAVTEVKPAAAVKPAGSDLLSARERAAMDEINLARANPAAYIKFLEEFKQYYRGKEIHYPDGSTLVSNEGVAALDEAIAFMRPLKPLPPLELRVGMVFAARDHVNDLVKTGKSGHKGSDGSNVQDRLSRYGTWEDSVGEDIVYHSRTAREDVIALIIDDGVSTRGHRKNIFKPDFRVIGIALSPPLEPGTLCIITFAGGFKDKPKDKPPDKLMPNQKPTAPSAIKY